MEEWESDEIDQVGKMREELDRLYKISAGDVSAFFGKYSPVLALLSDGKSKITKKLDEIEKDAKNKAASCKGLLVQVIPKYRLFYDIYGHSRYNVGPFEQGPFTCDKEFHLPFTLITYSTDNRDNPNFEDTAIGYCFRDRTCPWVHRVESCEIAPQFCGYGCREKEYEYYKARYSRGNKMCITWGQPKLDSATKRGVVLRLSHISKFMSTDRHGRMKFEWFPKFLAEFPRANLLQCYVETEISECNLNNLLVIFAESPIPVSINLPSSVMYYDNMRPYLEKCIKTCNVFNYTDAYFRVLHHVFEGEQLVKLVSHIKHVVIKDSTEIDKFMQLAGFFDAAESIVVQYVRSESAVGGMLESLTSNLECFPHLVDLHLFLKGPLNDMYILVDECFSSNSSNSSDDQDASFKFCDSEYDSAPKKRKNTPEHYRSSSGKDLRHIVAEFLASRNRQVFECLGIIGSGQLDSCHLPGYLYSDSVMVRIDKPASVYASEKRYIKMLSMI